MTAFRTTLKTECDYRHKDLKQHNFLNNSGAVVSALNTDLKDMPKPWKRLFLLAGVMHCCPLVQQTACHFAWSDNCPSAVTEFYKLEVTFKSNPRSADSDLAIDLGPPGKKKARKNKGKGRGKGAASAGTGDTAPVVSNMSFPRAIKAMIEEGCWQALAQGCDILDMLGDRALEVVCLFFRLALKKRVELLTDNAQVSAAAGLCPHRIPHMIVGLTEH